MASFLYFGAGVGVGLMYLFHWGKEKKQDRLAREDLPYTIGMVILDILAPILLMLGISIGSSANASLCSATRFLRNRDKKNEKNEGKYLK